MERPSGWINRHQVVAFFVVSFVLSWGLWLPRILSRIELLEIPAFFGVFGPAVACILISRVVEPGPRTNGGNTRRVAFVLTWIAATLTFWLNARSTSALVSPVAIAIFAIFALAPALIVSSAFASVPGVRKALSSLAQPRGGVGWHLLAVLLLPALQALSVPLSRALDWELLSRPGQMAGSQLVGKVVTSFLYTALFAGGLNEEGGWTAFALPRLQSRHSPLVATVILWVFWILWHAPLQLAGLWNPNIESLTHAMIGTFFGRFLFTWLYNRTRGGVLTAVLLHTSANVASQFLPLSYTSLFLEAIAAIIVVVADRMWKQLPANSPAVYQAIEPTT